MAPSSAKDAKGLLISSVKDDMPVIFFEHRWLHNINGNVPKKLYSVNMGNVKNNLDKVINGEKFKKFKEVIAKEGNVEACNHCGWLKPLN